MATLSNKILFVDDDPAIIRLFKRLLSKSGFEVDVAADPMEALAKVRGGAVYGLVVSDYSMPGASGLDLIYELRDYLPLASYGILSGCCDLEMALAAINEHEIDFILQKPWSGHELADRLLSAQRRHFERVHAHQLALKATTQTAA